MKRILAGGADAYLLADSIDELAEKLSGAVGDRGIGALDAA